MTTQSGIMVEVIKPNLRASVINLGLEIVSQSSTSNRINALEIGCMYQNIEGFSTIIRPFRESLCKTISNSCKHTSG